MAQNQQGEAFGRRVAPWRARASSGMQLALAPQPPPSILRRPRRTADADWEDENEDGVTDVYADRVTLVFNKVGIPDDETTRELPWPAVRRAPAPAVALPSLPPWALGVPWASLPAASLPPLVRGTKAWTLPPRLGVGSLRAAVAVAAAALLALIALGGRPGRGQILVNARDSLGGPVSRVEVFVDGERAPCSAVPCYVPSSKGLHEVKVNAEGFEAPAVQAVAVASGDPTAVSFIVGTSSEPSTKVSGSQVVESDDGRAEKRDAVMLEPKPSAAAAAAVPARDPGATPGLPAHPAPAAPAPKASPPRGGGARGDGYLNINSIPASACFLDGRALGSTPHLRVSVSAGSHTVKFRDLERGSTKTVVVNVGVGETRLAVARLN
jgi:hypothetical protein